MAPLPTPDPSAPAPDLRDACSVWQSERDGGSSLLRGAARHLTGIPHYFEAAFIRKYEEEAANDPASLKRARLLLAAVAESERRSANEWCAALHIPASGFAGRGLASKQEDDAIRRVLAQGTIDMPLWGVSLDEGVAISFGGDDLAFLFVIDGPFHGVAASVESGVKAHEREVITGGRYKVASVEEREGTTRATLREYARIWPSGS